MSKETIKMGPSIDPMSGYFMNVTRLTVLV